VSPRIAVLGAGLAVILVGGGIAVSSGAVPLASNSLAQTPKAVKLVVVPTLSEPSVNSFSYAVASVPASLRAHPKPVVKHTAKPKPTPTPTPSASTTTAAPTPTETPTQQQSTQAAALSPEYLAEYQTPTGEAQKVWSEAMLNALGAPLTSANIISMGYWMQNEAGGPGAGIVGANNPINVSQPCCGGVPIQDDGDGVTFLQSYPTPADGIEATVEYLERANFPTILGDLKAGVGLMNDGNLASEISLYSGGGYSTIPDSWGSSQGQPLG
jgi:hypothetical protein